MELLNNAEIIQFFDYHFKIKIPREFLSKPSKELLMPIFCKFLSDLGYENITQPDLSATDTIENIEPYELIITKINMCRCIEMILKSAGMTDSYGIEDLLIPEKRKTNRVLSLIIKVWTRFMNIGYHWNQIASKTFDLPQQMKSVELRINHLKKRIEERSLILSRDKEKYTQMDQEFKRLKKEYEELKSQHNKLKDEKKIGKNKIIKRKDELSDVSVKILQNKEVIANLEEKMVRSPLRVQSETRDKETQLKELRTDKQNLEKEYLHHMRLIESLSIALKQLKPEIAAFIEALKDMEKIRETCEAIDDLKMKGIDREKRIKEMQIKLREQENCLEKIKKNMHQNDIHYQKKLQVLSQLNNGLKMELEKKGAKTQYKVVIDEQISLEEELKRINETFQIQKSTVNECYQKIVQHFDTAKKAIIARLKEIQSKKS